MNRILTPALVLLLSACDATVPVPNGPPTPEPSQDTCNASQYSALIGQDATALERVLILSQVRVIRPGQAVTMDFRPERINFNVDGANRITSISCN